MSAFSNSYTHEDFTLTISRKNKNGTTTRYVQLAHNEHNPVTGMPQAKVLYHFGRADELDTEGLKRLAASIHRFIGEPLPSGSEKPDRHPLHC